MSHFTDRKLRFKEYRLPAQSHRLLSGRNRNWIKLFKSKVRVFNSHAISTSSPRKLSFSFNTGPTGGSTNFVCELLFSLHDLPWISMIITCWFSFRLLFSKRREWTNLKLTAGLECQGLSSLRVQRNLPPKKAMASELLSRLSLPTGLDCSILLVLNGELFVLDPVLVFCSVDLKIGDFLASWSSLCLGNRHGILLFFSLFSKRTAPPVTIPCFSSWKPTWANS